MKIVIVAAIGLAAPVIAQFGGGDSTGAGAPVNGKTPATLATGPIKAGFWADPSLPRHTIFGPLNPAAGLKTPVMVWGNGACSGNGSLFRRSLFEVASHGFFVIANGAPTGGGGQTKYTMQMDALSWVEKNAGKGQYAYVDGSRIAAAGQSCGGLEAYEVAVKAGPERVQYLGIFNSGEFTTSRTSLQVKQPVFYFLGGSSDMAYPNGERDYKNIAKTHIKWKGNLPVGHMATWHDNNGGKFGKAEWKWLDWVLKGNQESGQFFTGGGAKADGWSVEMANLDQIKVFPPYSG